MSKEFTIKKTTMWQGIAGVLFLLLLASIFTGGFGIMNKEAPKADKPVPEDPTKIDTKNWDLSGEPMLGDSDAPVTIIIFDDFECPFCARFEQTAFLELKEKYIDTGKVKFYYMHFPLSFHQHAKMAAEAAECAHEQGMFWELHGKIFANQGSLNEESIMRWAGEVDINTAKLKTCMNEHKYEQQVTNEFMLGQKAGIQGTPSFLINGKLLVGAQPFEAFKQIIDSELN